MSTTDNVLLIIITSLLSLFLLLGIIVVILIIRVMSSVRRVADRAEHVITSVESAADVFKDASGKMAMFKVLKNIVELVQRKR